MLLPLFAVPPLFDQIWTQHFLTSRPLPLGSPLFLVDGCAHPRPAFPPSFFLIRMNKVRDRLLSSSHLPLFGFCSPQTGFRGIPSGGPRIDFYVQRGVLFPFSLSRQMFFFPHDAPPLLVLLSQLPLVAFFFFVWYPLPSGSFAEFVPFSRSVLKFPPSAPTVYKIV